MTDSNERISRLAAIAPGQSSSSSDGRSSANFSQRGARVVGVIQEVDLALGRILWQRIRYTRGASRVPTIGEYDRYGPVEIGYPLETAILNDYIVWKWGSGPISRATHPIMANFRGGHWIIEIPLKPDGSVLVGTILPAAGGQG